MIAYQFKASSMASATVSVNTTIRSAIAFRPLGPELHTLRPYWPAAPAPVQIMESSFSLFDILFSLVCSAIRSVLCCCIFLITDNAPEGLRLNSSLVDAETGVGPL